ncbi:nitroreductase [Actinoalloteichus hoggarensis]|uniref:5,6-dimethylbenzimidazole synthase n=1 Tax=Actinoalloteichus hoggarensis TaxID=1470176 RepID=A0A221W4Q5_9PSEU|nr:nitroreductase family protein [Actinoalloteichus hoggarensis]ASO20693.1 5,6-dimethylbenzimidazole synthase [Actinoalloteichus hoggarensis]MBB5924454.1 nitroreductase [Actinoalloteichus hoggarensis]
MEFKDVVRRRRMVRNYQPDKPVPDEVVDRLLRHAVRAPSAGFAQGWGFLVLREKEDLERFWSVTIPPEAAPVYETMRNAPLVVVPHSSMVEYQQAAQWYAASREEQNKAWLEQAEKIRDEDPEAVDGWSDSDDEADVVPMWHVDTGFATLMMLLTSVDEGLGAAFFGFIPNRIAAYRAEFGVPDHHVPLGGLTIGYRADDSSLPTFRLRERRPLSEVVHHGRWGSSNPQDRR